MKYGLSGCVIVTSCPPANQLERLMARGTLSREEAQRRIDAQAPLADKIAVADFVIDTTAAIAATDAQLRAALDALQRESAAR